MMDRHGKWHNNITCLSCRRRHPATFTCDDAASIAKEQAKQRSTELKHADQWREICDRSKAFYISGQYKGLMIKEDDLVLIGSMLGT